jgi:hypothetical protein
MTMTSEQALVVLGRLAVAERDEAQRKPLMIGPFSCYVLISAIQLVMRHPELEGGPTVDVLTQLRDQLLAAFPEGSDVRAILAMGMDPAHDVPTVGTVGVGPVGCPECGSRTWHFEDDQTLTCKECGHCTTMEFLITESGSVGGVIETPVSRIPVRVDKEHVDFPCPICGGVDWHPMEFAYGCDLCRTVFSRDIILGLIDAMLKMTPASGRPE